MTRRHVNRKLRLVYIAIALVLAVSASAALAPHIPGVPTGLVAMALPVYELLRDMSLLIATLAAAYLANVFQKRSTFVSSLEREWRNIVKTKSALYTYCERENPTRDDYLAAYCQLSETIDTMRLVYKNAGETDKLIGLYPYAPLHDMRRVLQDLDPAAFDRPITNEDRMRARAAILQAFSALRENFLEELDLEEPTHPLLIAGGRRLKTSGATRGALSKLKRQRRRQERAHVNMTAIDRHMLDLYDREEPGNISRRRDGAANVARSSPKRKES